MLSKEFVEEMKKALLAHKGKLTEDLAGFSAHTEMGDDIEATQDEAEQDFDNQGVRQTFQEDLKKINAALARIENGTYGTDGEGKEIPEDRLRALPWADTNI